MVYFLIFLVILFFTLTTTLFINWLQNRRYQDKFLNKVKDSLGNLSLEALSKNSEEFIKLANETLSAQTKTGTKELENKKELINENLSAVKTEMSKIKTLVTSLEKDRENKYSKLSSEIKAAAQQTDKLLDTTNALKNALASTKIRGQWGERMAEDVLRLAGFIEGINYQKQKSLENSSARPDFTFLLPQNLKVNMDVKFPFDNYIKYLEAEGKIEKEKFKAQFLKDAKARIKEVTTRDYINPEENTLDYVIIFIPNEQIYSFINESDHLLLDNALKNKVIICSPLTLYAILAVIRQAVDNFNLEKTATKIMALLSSFNKQWQLFVKSFDKMGQKINNAQKEFDLLTTIRRRQLERPLKQIDDLRKEKNTVESPQIEKVEVIKKN